MWFLGHKDLKIWKEFKPISHLLNESSTDVLGTTPVGVSQLPAGTAAGTWSEHLLALLWTPCLEMFKASSVADPSFLGYV